MASVKPIAVNYMMFVNPFAANGVKTAQIHSWWYEEITRIVPAQKISNPPHGYISVVNESSQCFLSSLTLCIGLSQRSLAPAQQWYTAARLQSTAFTDLKQSRLQRSRTRLPGHWPRTGQYAPQTFMRYSQTSFVVSSLTWWSIYEYKYWFAVTEIVNLIHRTYFYGIWQMGMKHGSLIDKINQTFIALAVTAIHHWLSAWKTDEYRVPPQFGPGGGAQCKCDTRNIDHAMNTACTDVFRCLNVDFISSSPEVQAKKIENIRTMIHWRIHSTGMDPAMAQPHNDHGSFDEDILNCIPEELIEQPDNSFDCLSSFIAATEASMLFSAVLPMGRSPLLAAASPSPAATPTATATTSPTYPVLRIWD